MNWTDFLIKEWLKEQIPYCLGAGAALGVAWLLTIVFFSL